MGNIVRIREQEEKRRIKFKVTPRDEEELDWYIASLCGIGA
jgi:hypothetical protein